MEKRNLPQLQDLYKDQGIAIQQNQLNVLLNKDPLQDWVFNHPIAKGVKYIPIARIEYLLTSIFTKWKVEIMNIQLIANSVCVTIRLHYKDPITGEWDWQDGVGANPLQTDKDATATDWTRIKSDAVMKAAPAAETFAIKDAAEKLGKLFGKDLNRNDDIGYDNLNKRFEISQLKKRLSDLISQCQDEELNQSIIKTVTEAEENNQNTPEFYQEMIKKYKHDN